MPPCMPFLCPHIRKVCEQNIMQIACGNSTKFTTLGAVGDKGELRSEG